MAERDKTPYEVLKERKVPMVEIHDPRDPKFGAYIAKLPEGGMRIGTRGPAAETSMVLHTGKKAFTFIFDVVRLFKVLTPDDPLNAQLALNKILAAYPAEMFEDEARARLSKDAEGGLFASRETAKALLVLLDAVKEAKT